MNTQLLERVMQFILDHPEMHDQTEWCGTAQCFAGWTAALDGWHRSRSLPPLWHRDGEDKTIWEIARDALGLSTVDADVLFHACNSIADLQLMVKDLLNGECLSANQEYWYLNS